MKWQKQELAGDIIILNTIIISTIYDDDHHHDRMIRYEEPTELAGEKAG